MSDFDSAREHFCDGCKPIWDSSKAILTEYLDGREALIGQLHANHVESHRRVVAAVHDLVDQRRAALAAEREATEPWDSERMEILRLREEELSWLHRYGETVANELSLQGEHIQLDNPK